MSRKPSPLIFPFNGFAKGEVPSGASGKRKKICFGWYGGKYNHPHQSRGDSKAYGFEMSDAQHEELAKVLNRIKGKAAVSGYRCEVDPVFLDTGLRDN
jgi:site-specific DNA-adenine methylase